MNPGQLDTPDFEEDAAQGSLLPGSPTARKVFFCALFFYSVLYVASLYLHAATASLTEGYLPGIGALRCLHPLLLFVLAYALCTSLPHPHHRSTLLSIATLSLTLVLLLFVAAEPQSLDTIEATDVASKLRKSLLTPSFSMRSCITVLLMMAASGVATCASFLALLREHKPGAPATP